MKYPYIVKKNGVWYPSGTEVPEDISPQNDTSDHLTEKLVHNGYTKTEINRMSTAELQSLALENSIENANEMTGGDLKKVLIGKFGL